MWAFLETTLLKPDLSAGLWIIWLWVEFQCSL